MTINFSVVVLAALFFISPALTVAQPANTSEAELKVVRVAESQIAVNGTITIVVEGLDKWLQQPGRDGSKFVLYIDGNEFPDLPSSPIDVPDKNGSVKALVFDLLRKSQNRSSWTAVFSRRRPGEFSNRNVLVTVKHPEVRVIGQTVANLRVIDWTYFWWFLLFGAAFGLFFWFLSYKTDMIRTAGPEPTGLDTKGKPKRKAYSLARAQMAFWFFAAILAYLFIWIVTGYQITIPASILMLIGISAATGLSSAVIDSSRRTDQQNTLRIVREKRKALDVETQQLQSEISALNASLATAPPPADPAKIQDDLIAKQGALTAKQTEIAQADADIARLQACLEPLATKNFISDILSDDDGISFHRLQIFAWTMVLILIFIVSVYDVLAMPDFDTTLLALMGISGGTYIGFKLPNQSG